MEAGSVCLVGAGPGDPGLLTLAGADVLSTADVVLYDRLVHPRVLAHARPEAERIYVGKSSAQHAMSQQEINALLVERARSGLRVARLKGGDPFVFGRGAEEAEACRAAGVPFTVAPGVTSAIAAPAYAGIPLTHRDVASSFAVITAHERDDGRGPLRAEHGEERRDWARLAHAADTLVFLMGVETLETVVSRLLEHGRPPETPVALVEWGAWSRQRVVTGALSTVLAAAREARLSPPCVCVVGEVVRLRERLRWFDLPGVRPLAGKRVLVTRAREQAGALSRALEDAGAEAIEFPVIRIRAIQHNNDLDAALVRLHDYDWCVFTSANTVSVIAGRLQSLGADARAFGGTRIAAIGPATAAALAERLCLKADFVPAEAVSEAVVAQWPDADLTGSRILLPRAAEARSLLPDELARRGAVVETIPVYETLLDDAGSPGILDRLQRGEIDAVTFTASSTVRNFARAVAAGNEAPLRDLIGDTCVAVIGPVTEATAREYGLTPVVVAETHTVEGLVDAIKRRFDV